MDARQQHYLEAMGITPWVRRGLEPVAESGPRSEPVPETVPSIVPVRAASVQAEGLTATASAPAVVVPAAAHTSVSAPLAEIPAAAQSAPLMAPAMPVVPATDWDGLAQQVDGCQQCGLYKTRMNAVLGAGHDRPRWMLIGEAPGADEDKQRLPFVGEAGQLLDAMLQAAGVRREAVYMTHIIKCRPPGNRRPKADEVNACSAYLQRQIELLQPGLIIALGELAAQALLQSEDDISQLRGRVHRFGPTQIPLIASYHPAHLLRTPADKRHSWQDLQRAMSECPPNTPV